jgi:hypothetical protein
MGVFDNIYYDVTKRNPQPKKRNFDFLSKEEERDAYKWVKKAYPVYDWDSYVSDRIDPTKQEADYNTYWGAMNQYRYNRDRTYSGKDALDFGDAAYNPYDADDDSNTAYADYYKTFGKAPQNPAEIEQHKTRLTYKDQYDKTLAEDVAAYEKGMKPLKYQVSDRIKSEYDALAKLAQSGQNPMEYLDTTAPTIAKLHRATIQAEADRQRKLAESEEAAAPDMSDIYGTKKTKSKLDLDTLKALGYDEKTGFKFLNDGSFTMKRADDVQAMEDRNMATNMFPSLKPTMPKPRAVTPPEVQAQRTSEGRVGTAIGRGPQRPRSEIEQLRATGGPFGTRVPDWISTDYLKAAKVARDIVNLTPGMIAGRAVTTLPQELFKEGVATLQDLSQGEQATFDMPKWTFDRGFDSGQSYVGVIQDALDYNLKNGTRLGPFTTQEMQMFSDALKDPVVSTVVNVVGEANIDPLNIVGSRWFAEIVALRKAGKTAEAAELANRVVDAAQTAKAANTADTAVDAASAVSPSAMRQSRPVATRATRLADASVMPAPRQVGTVTPADLRATQRPGVVARAASGADNVAMAADDTATLTATGKATATPESQYIPKGEAPRREIDVLAQTEAGPTKRYARTMAESPAISEDMAKTIVKDVEAGKYAREVIGDKAAITTAAQRISEKGYAGALDDWNAKITSGKRLDKYDIAQGDLLLQMADQAKDGATAQKIAAELATELSEAGRNLQAARLFKQLTPEGDLMRAERAIDKLNTKFEKQIANGKMPKMGMTDDEVLDVLSTTDKAAREKVLEDIARRINSELPSTWAERFEAWRYTSMLSNPTTHAKNFLSNVIFYPMRKFSDMLAIPIERASGAIAKKLGRNVEQTKAIINPLKDKALLDAGGDSFKGIKNQLMGIKEDFGGTMAAGRKVYTSKAFEWLEWWRKANPKALDAEDFLFLRGEYKSSFAQYMKANKLTPDMLKADATKLAKVEQYAARRALEATFRNESALANWLTKIERRNPATRVLVGAVAPFKKTPINILKQGAAYSPGGLVKSLSVDFARLKAGKINATQLIENVTKGLTGTMMVGTGAWLASMGLVQGRIKQTGKAEDYMKDMGSMEYALVVGDKEYSLEWIQPAILPIIMGAELYASYKDEKNLDLDAFPRFLDAMLSISDPMFNTTMLQGVNKLIQGNYGDSAASVAVNMGVDLAAGYATQFMPTLFGQVGREVAGEKKSYYVGGETATTRALEQPIRSAGARIGVGEPSLDMWGQPKKNIPGSQFSPARMNERRDTAVDREVLRLYRATADSRILPGYAYKSYDYEDKTYRLTAREYTEAQRTQGQYAFEEINRLIQTSAYRKMTDGEKAKALVKIYDEARLRAKTGFFASRGISLEKKN